MAGRRGSSVGGFCLALVALLMPACSGVESIEAAHAVFLTRAECPYFVTNETQNAFAVLTPEEGYVPRQGDLLVGNLREGELPLGVVPFAVQEITRTVPFQVVGYDLSLAQAQDLYYGFCPLPPEEIPPGTPGLPLAPEGVPLDVPPDTAGTF